MGLSQSWLAVRSERADEVLGALSIVRTGEFEEAPESKICGIGLPSGWYLVLWNRCDYAEGLPLAELSRGGEVQTFSVEEHVMVCGTAHWSEGREQWSVWHDAQEGEDHLDTGGTLPRELVDIRSTLLAQATPGSDVDDVFEVPVEIAHAVTGYRYDLFPPVPDEKPYERLESMRPWWQFWR